MMIEAKDEKPASFWNETNSQSFVIAVMQLLSSVVTDENVRKEYIAEAHVHAGKNKTAKQWEYDISFAETIRCALVWRQAVDSQAVTDWALLEMMKPKPQPTPVATEKPITAAKVFETPKATAYEGPAFDIPGVALLPGTIKPAAPKPLEKPDLNAKSRPVLEQAPSKVSRKHAKKNPGGRAIIYHAPDQIPMAPWGLPAVELCEWAWRLIEADDHSKMSMNQLYNCAKILSVLVYAGVVPPNSIIPMGMTNKNFGGKY